MNALRSSVFARAKEFTPSFPWITARLVQCVLAIAVLVALSAAVPGLLWVAGLACVALLCAVAADLAIGPRRADFDVERLPCEHLSLRKPARLRYEIVNRTGANLQYEIVDTPVDELELPEQPLDGFVGAGRRKVAELAVVPRLRGEARLQTVFVSVRNRVGLVVRRFRCGGEEHVRIFPDLSAVERYGELARRGRLSDAGFRKLRLRGQGGEFDALREWVPDDEFRSINWKATARRGKLMVAQYDVERSQTVSLVLDAGRLMTPRLGDQRKFDYAVTAALSVAHIAALADDKVGLLAFAGEILEYIAPRAGASHANGMTRRLYDLQPLFEESDYARGFAYLRRRQPKRSLVIFFTDMFDPVACAAALANMSQISPRHLALCVLMNDEALSTALSEPPQTAHQAYKAGVAATLLEQRRKAAAMLMRRGISVIDVPAKQLTVALINAYIEVKARSLL